MRNMIKTFQTNECKEFFAIYPACVKCLFKLFPFTTLSVSFPRLLYALKFLLYSNLLMHALKNPESSSLESDSEGFDLNYK